MGTPTRVTDGSTTQVHDRETVLHRILVGEAPALDVTIELRNGAEDSDPLVTQVLMPGGAGLSGDPDWPAVHGRPAGQSLATRST